MMRRVQGYLFQTESARSESTRGFFQRTGFADECPGRGAPGIQGGASMADESAVGEDEIESGYDTVLDDLDGDMSETAHSKREGLQEQNGAREQYLGMAPTHLNNLIVSYVYGALARRYDTESGTVRVQGQQKGSVLTAVWGGTGDVGPYQVDVSYLILKPKNASSSPSGSSTRVIFQATKDAKGADGARNLAHINDVIKAFFAERRDLDPGAILMMPLAQCRPRLGSLLAHSKKKHWVLVEYGPKEVIVHNSQSNMSNVLYPNCLNENEILGLRHEGEGRELPRKVTMLYHGQQAKGSNDCGLYVYCYLQDILDSRDPKDHKKVSMVGNITQSPWQLLQSLIEQNLNQNLGERSSGHSERASTASAPRARASGLFSHPIPWKREEFDELTSGDHPEGVDGGALLSLDDLAISGKGEMEGGEDSDLLRESICMAGGGFPRVVGGLAWMKDLWDRFVLFLRNLLGIAVQGRMQTTNRGGRGGASGMEQEGGLEEESSSIIASEPPSFSEARLSLVSLSEAETIGQADADYWIQEPRSFSTYANEQELKVLSTGGDQMIELAETMIRAAATSAYAAQVEAGTGARVARVTAGVLSRFSFFSNTDIPFSEPDQGVAQDAECPELRFNSPY